MDADYLPDQLMEAANPVDTPKEYNSKQGLPPIGRQARELV
jgi:hypothetical protein